MSDWKNQVAEFRKAQKIEPFSLATSRLCVGFFGLVGGGKSSTAGILAVGITPDGLIGWIDGENRRSGFAADNVSKLAAKYYGKPEASFAERFKFIHLEPPFNPLAAVAAIESLEEQGCKTIIADCCSQLWDSEGGYMDMREDEIDRMAGRDDGKRNRVAAAAAAHVKPWTHAKFVSKVNSTHCNVVLVFQAKNKWNPSANKPNEFVSPIQESGLTRTALVVGRVEADDNGNGGYCSFTGPSNQGVKHTHPSILALLPKPQEQFHFRHAEAIAQWVNGTKPATNGKSIKVKLWDAIPADKKVGATRQAQVQAVENWLIDKTLMSDTETLSNLTEDRMKGILEALPNL